MSGRIRNRLVAYRTRFPAALALALVFACLSPAAHARAQTIRSIETVAQRSDVIVQGYVVEVEALELGPEGQDGIHTRVRLEVERDLIGQTGDVVEFWVHGGRVGGRVRHVSGQATFEPGERVLVFLFRNAYGSLWPAAFNVAKWFVLESRSGTYVRPARWSLEGMGLSRVALTEAIARGRRQ